MDRNLCTLATAFSTNYTHPHPFGIDTTGELRNLSTRKLVLLHKQNPGLAVHLFVRMPDGLIEVEQRGIANHPQPSSRVL